MSEVSGLSLASFVFTDVTATGPRGSGHLTVYPTGATRPDASNLNFSRGQTIANLVTVPVGDDGTITIHNGSPEGTHVIADVVGFHGVR